MCATASSLSIAAFFILCMKTGSPAISLIRNLPAWSEMLLVNITPTAIAPFMTPSCVWRRISLCRCRCWTGRVISAPLTAIRPPLCDIPKCAWITPPHSYSRISKKIRSTFRKIMTPLKVSLSSFPLVTPISWLTARAVLLWVWPPISRRIIWARSATRPWRFWKTPISAIMTCWILFPGLTSRLVALSWDVAGPSRRC